MLADGRTSRQTIARLRLTYIQPMACCLFHKNTKNFLIILVTNNISFAIFVAKI
jgi:hypothetical protein